MTVAVKRLQLQVYVLYNQDDQQTSCHAGQHW